MTTYSFLSSSDISFVILQHRHRQRGKTTPILKMAGNILEILRTGFPARRESARGSPGCLSKDNTRWAPSVSVDYFLLWAKKNTKERNRKVMSIAQDSLPSSIDMFSSTYIRQPHVWIVTNPHFSIFELYEGFDSQDFYQLIDLAVDRFCHKFCLRTGFSSDLW